MPRMTKAEQIQKFRQTLHYDGFVSTSIPWDTLVNGNEALSKNWRRICAYKRTHPLPRRPGY